MEDSFMKKRKIVSLMLAVICTLSLVLTGCSGDKKTDNTTPDTKDSGTASTAEGTKDTAESTSAGIDHTNPLTLEFYDVAANYQGTQSGWFAKVIKDKFNLELNIIAPQASGDGEALYQTRTAAGKLGDIILLDNSPLQDCIKAGLIADISTDVQNSKNLNQYYDQYKTFNAGLEGNSDGKIYGLPCEITNTSPTTYSDDTVAISPMLPWDYYSEIGAPEMKNLDDLLNVLEKIQKAHPTNDKGDANYAISLWPDWDKGGSQVTMETATQLTKTYGYEVKGAVMLGNKGDIKEVTDDSGAYYKMLKFFYDANQRGLVDPDSGTQNWDTACTKMKNKQVLLFWYNWQRGFWNTPERANDKNAYIYAPVSDMDFYQPSDSYFGDGRAFAIGSQMEGNDRARAIEFMDWLSSPEGLQFIHDGIPDWSYTKGDDGKYTLTDNGLYGLMENRPVSEEWGGGGFDDGNSKINQWPLHSVSTNPNTGEPYNSNYWASYLEANKTTMTKEWTAKYGGENQVKYLESTGQLKPVPNVNIILPSDSTDIALTRSQCATLICDTSWRMVFATSEDEFKSMWADMKTQLDGLGWADLVASDKATYQKVLDARAAATK
jgi:multiple sugar transport system substrate-binding protein/putative aldouronate transport system substrate-binding protein